MDDLRFPIGKFQKTEQVTDALRLECIQHISEAPANVRAAIKGLSEEQLDTPYREGGWTVRQVVHHLSDSHMNAYIRFKLALTEETPTIKTYDQNKWADLIDARTASAESGTRNLEALHERWVILLRSMKPEDFLRKFNHPEHGIMGLDFLLQLYSWHGKHHVAHINGLRERNQW